MPRDGGLAADPIMPGERERLSGSERHMPRPRASTSTIASPPNFSRSAFASSHATTASPTIAAAGTAHTSLRS